ncbi:MAG TPA: hypothetical protein DC046_04350 [Rhodospirillaceae bacterium]|nr:hypothetical protein [Rhodospirillaceae bacterium]
MRIRDLLPTAMLVGFCILWLAIAALRPQSGQSQIGVVFPPSLTETEILARIADAGGRLVREGAWPFIAVVALDTPETLTRLGSQGALFTVNPLALGSCLTRPAAN